MTHPESSADEFMGRNSLLSKLKHFCDLVELKLDKVLSTNFECEDYINILHNKSCSDRNLRNELYQVYCKLLLSFKGDQLRQPYNDENLELLLYEELRHIKFVEELVTEILLQGGNTESKLKHPSNPC